MAIYHFTLTETYSKNIEIEAAREDEARDIFEEDYYAGDPACTMDIAEDFDEWDLFLNYVTD